MIVEMEFYEVAGFDEREDTFRSKFFDYTRVMLSYYGTRELFRMFRGNPSPAAITYDGTSANEHEVCSWASTQDLIDLIFSRDPSQRHRIEYCI